MSEGCPMHRPIPILGLLSALALSGLAAGSGKSIPDYSTKPRSEVPETFRWKIEDLYPDQAAWAAEKARVELLLKELEPAIPGWTSSASRMAGLLERITDIQIRMRRLSAYASLQSDMDLADSTFQKMKGEMQVLSVKMGSLLSFFAPDVQALGAEKVEEWIKAEPRLAPYAVRLHRTLREKAHTLPAEQEKLVSMTGLFSQAPSKASTLLNDVDIPNPELTLEDGSRVLLNRANFVRQRASAVTSDRRRAMETYWNSIHQYENTLAALMDAGIKQHLFTTQIRHFPDCLSARLFDNDISPEVYHNLIRTVRSHLGPLHRLLRLRKDLLGLKDFSYGDVYASAVASAERTYTFDEARQLVQESTRPLGPEYAEALRTAFDNRWIDLYPNRGKQSGAYSSGVYGVHPYVKMNFDGSYDTVSTLAHELGHAMHSWFSSRTQPFPNAQYPTFLAEIASTFNENMLIHQMLRSETDDAVKLYLLDSYLEQLRGTIYRQTLFAEFELAMHQRVESGQALTADWLNARYLELTRQYYGQDQGVMDVPAYIGSEWASIPHFYMNYYVFQYSTGIVASMALADAVLQQGEPARDRYLEMLRSGDIRFPLDTLRIAGVDMSSPAPVEAALRQFDSLVGEMETIAARMAAKKSAH